MALNVGYNLRTLVVGSRYWGLLFPRIFMEKNLLLHIEGKFLIGLKGLMEACHRSTHASRLKNTDCNLEGSGCSILIGRSLELHHIG